MFRLAVQLHRYLGIAIGFVVALWCLSAFVMMYVQYPELTEKTRVAGLDPLDLSACCLRADPTRSLGEPGFGWIDGFRVEMLAGRPMLRLMVGPSEQLVDLGSGAPLPGVSEEVAAAAGSTLARRLHIGGEVRSLGAVSRDQWTVALPSEAPLYRFAAGDAAGTEWYVSRTGEVVQMTTTRQRFWNWLGSIPHWIYFTALRSHGPAWAATVIWLSIAALFMTVLGGYIGLRQIRPGRNGRLSPYRGWTMWHHYAGLVFGVLTLTWLLSGLLSMNPWGALEGRSFAAERDGLRNADLTLEEISRVLQGLDGTRLPENTLRLESSVVDGRLSLIAWTDDGLRMRLDAVTLAPSPLPGEFFSRAAGLLRPGAEVAAEGWLEEGDAYYFSHHTEANFPIYRIRYADGERFYLDAVTGELVFAADAGRQRYRWLFEALHRGDFARVLRMRPVWDALMLPLLLGVTASAVTGTWLGLRRLTGGGRRRSRPSRAAPRAPAPARPPPRGEGA